jgi:type IV pilus assembly protein PilZ
MQVTKQPGARAGMLSVTITDKQDLYMSYMSFLKNGGIFIVASPSLNLGDDFQMGKEVLLLLTIPNDTQRIPVAGKIVWITPFGADGGRTPGFGVQFNDQEGIARNKIEAILAGSQESGRPTHTM